MIVEHSNRQVLECDICGELETLLRSQAAHPEERMIRVESMQADHKPCEQFANDIPRAKRARQFIRQMRKQKRLLDARRRRG